MRPSQYVPSFDTGVICDEHRSTNAEENFPRTTYGTAFGSNMSEGNSIVNPMIV